MRERIRRPDFGHLEIEVTVDDPKAYKKTLFILGRGAQDAEGNEVANAAQVWSIQMIAQGYKGRAK